jgi:hypothetical protein
MKTFQKHRHVSGTEYCEQCECEHPRLRKRGRSEAFGITSIKPYVISLMEKEGRDFHICEDCGDFIPDGEFILHHAKYEGATYKDLKILCRTCNVQPHNRGLS